MKQLREISPLWLGVLSLLLSLFLIDRSARAVNHSLAQQPFQRHVVNPQPEPEPGQSNPPVVEESPTIGRQLFGMHLLEVDSTAVKYINDSPDSNMKISLSQGVLIIKVLPNSAVAQAGLLPGDMIAKVNDNQVETLRSLDYHLIQQRYNNEPIAIEALRGTEFITTRLDPTITTTGVSSADTESSGLANYSPVIESLLTLPPLPKQNDTYAIGVFLKNSADVQNHEIGFAGLPVNPPPIPESMYKDEKFQFYNVLEDPPENIPGALIIAIRADSPAGISALQAGDIVTRAGDVQINNPSDLAAIVSSTGGQELQLEFVRKGTVYQTSIRPEILPARRTREEERYAEWVKNMREEKLYIY